MALALSLLILVGYSATHWAFPTRYRVLAVAEVVWPTSFWLLATDGNERSFQAKVIVAESILANGALYGLAGLAISVLRPNRRSA